jgi:hypothetical protein
VAPKTLRTRRETPWGLTEIVKCRMEIRLVEWLYDSRRTRRKVGSADYSSARYTAVRAEMYLLNSDGREDSLEHRAHKPELRQLRTIGLLLETIEHELLISCVLAFLVKSLSLQEGGS